MPSQCACVQPDLWRRMALLGTPTCKHHHKAATHVQGARNANKHVTIAPDTPRLHTDGEQSMDAPPPQELVVSPGEFSTELCECTSGPQACFLCCTACTLPCFGYGMIREHTQEGTQRGACQQYCLCGVAPMVIPYVGLLISCFAQLGMSTWARTHLREKYDLPGNACSGAPSLQISILRFLPGR